MSLSVAGVWQVGVWDTSVWADGVWREGEAAAVVAPDTKGGGESEEIREKYLKLKEKRRLIEKTVTQRVTTDLGEDIEVSFSPPVKELPEPIKEDAIPLQAITKGIERDLVSLLRIDAMERHRDEVKAAKDAHALYMTHLSVMLLLILEES